MNDVMDTYLWTINNYADTSMTNWTGIFKLGIINFQLQRGKTNVHLVASLYRRYVWYSKLEYTTKDIFNVSSNGPFSFFFNFFLEPQYQRLDMHTGKQPSNQINAEINRKTCLNESEGGAE